MLTLLILLSILALLLYYYGVKPMSHWKNRGVQQGKTVWFLGDTWKALFKMQSMAEIVVETYNKFKDARYFGVYDMNIPTLLVKDPELLKQITIKDFDHFLDHRNFLPENSDPLWEKNLFALRGQKWREMRPLLSPSFTSSKMRSIFVIMSDCVDTFLQHFMKEDEKFFDVELKDKFTRYGNDVIASAAFGVKVDSLAQPNNDFYVMGKEATNFSGVWDTIKFILFMLIPCINKVLNITLFKKEVSNFFINLVDETIRIREEKNIFRPDVLQLLIEARKGKAKQEENDTIDTGFATVKEAATHKNNNIKYSDITNLDIAAQAMIFFFGGFESVTTLMCFMAYELAINPEIQDKLRDEIKETHAACNGKLTYDVLMKMKYLDMVISESLRKWPTAVVVDRVCTKPYTIEPVEPNEKPLDLKVGDVLWISIFAFHRDPKYYPDPDKFDPERFNDENKSSINPYTYMPFGLGPRNCIGSRFALLETKTLFYHLLLNFEIVPNAKTVIPPVISKGSFNLTMEGGFNLRLKQIKSS